MDDYIRAALLSDFYGELLTDRQRQAYGMYYNENLTLQEISENLSITRQGARDLVRRAGVVLDDYEKKLKLVERNEKHRRMAGEIINILESAQDIAGENIKNYLLNAVDKIRHLNEV